MEKCHPNETHDALGKDLVCDGQGWIQAQHILFQVANLFILFAFFTPHTLMGHMLHKAFISAGFFALAIWVWLIKCIPDAVAWNTFLGLQALVSIHIDLWKMQAFYFPPEAELAYRNLFKKSGASRYDFNRILNAGKWSTLTQGLIETREGPSNRLRLVVSGRVDVSRNQQLLYSVHAFEFVESVDVYEPTQDPITIAEETRVLTWKSKKLSELLQDAHLQAIIDDVLARDICLKLGRLYVPPAVAEK